MSSLVVVDITWSMTSYCPPAKLLEPCTCNSGCIYCVGNEDIDLVKIFQTLENNLTKNEKHFNEFYLSNTFITELKENTFSDITFDNIHIHRCLNLKSIHKNAFTTTDQVINALYIEENPLLSSPNNSIFEAVNKFTQLVTWSLSGNNITEIPSNAFKNRQGQMKIITMYGQSIRKIGENVFSNFKNLERIHLIHTSIDFIPENAFEFKEESNQSLVLYISDNKFLNCSGFSEHSLTKFKRPTYIFLVHNTNFLYFDEKIFQPFFELNAKNRIFLSYGSVDCNDCRNYWLQKNPTLLKKVLDSSCTNSSKLIDDPANFANCKS